MNQLGVNRSNSWVRLILTPEFERFEHRGSIDRYTGVRLFRTLGFERSISQA